ncbi:hypothetical protein [Algivirga pacifica]|uniref:NACHT domain-containing NTPase n=1 Tax=Algivirga pacifica TaxID=1162670 RepID=A0ABP9D743_9BACT
MERDWRDYKSLYGGLEGARSAFEKHCADLFQEIYPDKNVKTVRVTQGDGGIDVFVGDYGNSPIVVIQCKFFLEAFENSQYQQVNDSFETAINNTEYSISEWILCIPYELSIKQHKWWGDWKSKKEKMYGLNEGFIKLLDGGNIIHLMNKHHIYNDVFKIEDSKSIQEIKEGVENLQRGLLSQGKKVSRDTFVRNIQSHIPSCYLPRFLINYQGVATTDILSPYSRETSDRFTLLDILDKENHIVLLGNAGLGKSTELKHAALEIAKLEGTRYPVFQSLSNFSASDTSLIVDLKGIDPEEVILFCDGLDEVEPEYFNTVKKKIGRFIEDYPKAKVVVSCRSNFFKLPGVSPKMLKGFSLFFLDKFSDTDVTYYINEADVDPNKLRSEAWDKGLYDLLFNPFYLSLILEVYKHNGHELPGKRSQLIEQIISLRIDWDEGHYENTIDIDEHKNHILFLLGKVALLMKRIGKTTLDDEQIRHLLKNKEDRDLIRYSGIFEKKEGLSKVWKFEHANFQEYLCARLLCTLPFEQVMEIVSEQGRVLPHWYNTVVHLISLLDDDYKREQIVEWLAENDKEVLVGCEYEVLSDDLRSTLFRQIFNYYKAKEIWVSSNYFREVDLALFGQSDENIEWVLEQIEDEHNHLRIRKSALMILENFDLERYPDQNKLMSKLLEFIQIDLDNDFKANVIRVIYKHKLYDFKYIDLVFKYVGDMPSKYIRKEMYTLISSADLVDEYWPYFREGLSYIYSEDKIKGRESNLAIGEEIVLFDSILKIKTYPILKELINDYKRKLVKRLYGSRSADCLQKIIERAASLYWYNDGLYEDLFSLSFDRFYWFNNEVSLVKLCISFFRKTDNSERLFNDLINYINEKPNYNYHCLWFIAYIEDLNTMQLLFAQKISGQVSKQHIEDYYHILKRIDINRAKRFRDEVRLIFDETIIDREEQITKRQLEYRQDSLNILFDKDAFFKYGIDTFDQIECITWNDVTKYDEYGRQADDQYLLPFKDAISDLLRGDKKSLCKKDFIEWFDDVDLQVYVVVKACELIYDSPELQLTHAQIEIIRKWFNQNISQIDFTKGFLMNENGSFQVNGKFFQLSRYLIILLKHFNFHCDEKILLDMLHLVIAREDVSALTFRGHYKVPLHITIDDIVLRLGIEKVSHRILVNLNNNLPLISMVFTEYVDFAVSNRIEKLYQPLLCFAVKAPYSSHTLKRTFSKLVDTDYRLMRDIKLLYDHVQIESKLDIIDISIEQGDKDFAYRKLSLLANIDELGEDIKKQINNYLINIGRIEGLSLSIEWIKRNWQNPFITSRANPENIISMESLPLMIELLDLSYNASMQTDHPIDRLDRLVINGIKSIAQNNIDQKELIKNELYLFVERNKTTYKDVVFLNTFIEDIDRMYLESNKNLKLMNVVEEINRFF